MAKNKRHITAATLVLITFALLGRSQAGSVGDDFNDGILDGSRWETVLTGGTADDGTVEETGGVIVLTNAGALNTVAEFVPSIDSPVTISFEFDFKSATDLIKVTTRTNGGRDGSNASATGGIEVVLHSLGVAGSPPVQIRINELDANGDPTQLGQTDAQVIGDSINRAVIVDNGLQISVSVNDQAPFVVSATLTSANNRVSFRNRETTGGQQRSFLDNVLIVQPDSGSVVAIDIDIKPGSDPNSINPRSKGVIAVAVLTTEDFDATQIDAATVLFGPDEASPSHAKKDPLGHFEDVDDDGDIDVVFHFKTQKTGIACGDTTATLTGETLGGQPLEGTDSVRTVGCK